jgi:serine/threonine protein kinase
VALKMVLACGHAGPVERARFRIEAEAVARLQHANIVQVFEVGEAGGHPYCVLEFVEGAASSRLSSTTGCWPTERPSRLCKRPRS